MTTTLALAATLQAIEEDTRRKFLALLEKNQIDAKEIDLPTFARIVRLAHFGGMAAGEFCSKFGVTLGTVSRWRTGVALPGQYLRNEVITFIKERLIELEAAA